MKFLVDAHLPRKLAYLLQDAGHDALHTLDLPMQNHTSDQEINRISSQDKRIVVTKDADFVNSHLASGQPSKLLLVSTGNIRNDDLLRLFERNLSQIVDAFNSASFVEIDRTLLSIHE